MRRTACQEGSPGVIGSEIHLDEEPHVVSGVMPEGFRFPYYWPKYEYWRPLVVGPNGPGTHTDVARLAADQRLTLTRVEYIYKLEILWSKRRSV